MFNQRFNELIYRDNTSNGDNGSYALFYIISTNDELFRKINKIYDFEERIIKSDVLDKAGFSSSAIALLRLAFNLFNSSNEADVSATMCRLDDRNFKIALNAITIRFRGVKLYE